MSEETSVSDAFEESRPEEPEAADVPAKSAPASKRDIKRNMAANSIERKRARDKLRQEGVRTLTLSVS